MLKLQYFGHLMWRADSLEETHQPPPTLHPPRKTTTTTKKQKKRWCWERLKTGGEGDDREWDGWMASLAQWTWVWASSGKWWWTGKPGVLQSMGSQGVGHDWATEQQQQRSGKSFLKKWHLSEICIKWESWNTDIQEWGKQDGRHRKCKTVRWEKWESWGAAEHPAAKISLNFLKKFCRSLVALPCCVSFYSTAKW